MACPVGSARDGWLVGVGWWLGTGSLVGWLVGNKVGVWERQQVGGGVEDDEGRGGRGILRL